MTTEWFEKEVKRVQARVPQTGPVKGAPPYPVYRPSNGEVVWVRDLDDVIFVSLAEKFLVNSEIMRKLGPIGRSFYRGRCKR